MKRTPTLLAGLLAVQLIAASALGFATRGASGPAKEAPLVALSDHSLDRITIEGSDRSKVILAKAKDGWQLPELGDFPADTTRVKEFVAALGKLREGLPVATTRDAQSRFKVSDSDFTRRVTLGGAEKSFATLYFGTAPSMREIHVRRSDQSDVFSVEFASWQMPAKVSDWENKALLQIPVKDIAAIDVAGLHIVHAQAKAANGNGAHASHSESNSSGSASGGTAVSASGGTSPGAAKHGTVDASWQATGIGAGESLDETAAASLAGSLADLEFDRVLAGTPPADDGLASPALELTVTRRGGERVTYTIGKSRDGKTYTLKTSSRSEAFDLPSYTAEPLITAASREKLLGIKIATPATKR